MTALVEARANRGVGLLRLIAAVARARSLAVGIEQQGLGRWSEWVTVRVCPPGEEILAALLRSEPGVLWVQVRPATPGRR